MMSIAHPSRRARIGNSAASIATCSYPALPLGTGASDPTASIAISGRLRRPVPARDEGKQSGGIDCNGNKHSGRVSEDIWGAATVVFARDMARRVQFCPSTALALSKSPKSMRFNFSLVLYRICLFK